MLQTETLACLADLCARGAIGKIGELISEASSMRFPSPEAKATRGGADRPKAGQESLQEPSDLSLGDGAFCSPQASTDAQCF